jgi:hypothetical protein
LISVFLDSKQEEKIFSTNDSRHFCDQEFI